MYSIGIDIGGTSIKIGLVDKKGEVKNIKASVSSGAEEVDNMLFNSTKTVIEKNPPSKYGISGENINLTLVVNF